MNKKSFLICGMCLFGTVSYSVFSSNNVQANEITNHTQVSSSHHSLEQRIHELFSDNEFRHIKDHVTKDTLAGFYEEVNQVADSLLKQKLMDQLGQAKSDLNSRDNLTNIVNQFFTNNSFNQVNYPKVKLEDFNVCRDIIKIAVGQGSLRDNLIKKVDMAEQLAVNIDQEIFNDFQNQVNQLFTNDNQTDIHSETTTEKVNQLEMEIKSLSPRIDKDSLLETTTKAQKILDIRAQLQQRTNQLFTNESKSAIRDDLTQNEIDTIRTDVQTLLVSGAYRDNILTEIKVAEEMLYSKLNQGKIQEEKIQQEVYNIFEDEAHQLLKDKIGIQELNQLSEKIQTLSNKDKQDSLQPLINIAKDQLKKIQFAEMVLNFIYSDINHTVLNPSANPKGFSPFKIYIENEHIGNSVKQRLSTDLNKAIQLANN